MITGRNYKDEWTCDGCLLQLNRTHICCTVPLINKAKEEAEFCRTCFFELDETGEPTETFLKRKQKERTQ